MKIKDTPLWHDYISAGFKTWTADAMRQIKGTPYFLQKRITKGKDTLFFITVYVYDCGEILFQPEAHFNTHGCPMFDVTYNDRGTPKQVELFFKRLYKAMKCKPYEKG